MGHRVGLFNYATQQTGGHVDFDHFLLSDTLTAQGRPLDTSRLDAAMAYAAALDEADHPADAWATMLDAPERALSYQLARLGVLRAELPVTVDVRARCVAGRAHLAVQARNDHDAPVDIVLETAYGARSVPDVAPGAHAYQQFNARDSAVPAGTVTVQVIGTVDGRTVATVRTTNHPAADC
ncbi:hypothetical protein [Verrucosispora sioxanthis]|uniref:hypothetical protein n=1 Tax=Verrucosispora sioxanthis TaxID=2499994 RepID=UPI0020A1D595|nr:hypothetical protein [Verrucosispora sioxanthis]